MKQIREENNNNGKKADKMHVKEWLHQNAKRPVKVKFGPDESFYLLNRKGDKLRTIPVKVSLFRACVHAILIGCAIIQYMYVYKIKCLAKYFVTDHYSPWKFPSA